MTGLVEEQRQRLLSGTPIQFMPYRDAMPLRRSTDALSLTRCQTVTRQTGPRAGQAFLYVTTLTRHLSEEPSQPLGLSVITINQRTVEKAHWLNHLPSLPSAAPYQHQPQLP